MSASATSCMCHTQIRYATTVTTAVRGLVTIASSKRQDAGQRLHMQIAGRAASGGLQDTTVEWCVDDFLHQECNHQIKSAFYE